MAVPFLAAILLAMRLEQRPDPRPPPTLRIRASSLRDETAAAGIRFVHKRPTFDPKIAERRAPRRRARRLGLRRRLRRRRLARPLLHEQPLRRAQRALPQQAATARSRTSPRAAGLADLNRPGEGVSMGAVWGDFDNDGREDVLVYRYGYLALFRNVDGRRFEDVTERAGLRRWVNSNGAIWLDYDRDGLLDLYVTAYFRDIDLWHLTTTRIMHNSFEFADQRREEPALPQPRRRQVRGRHRQDGRRQHALDARRRVGRLQRRRMAGHLPRQRLRSRRAVPQRSADGASCSTTAGLESESKSGMSVDARRRVQPRPARRVRHEHLRARLPLPEQQPAR